MYHIYGKLRDYNGTTDTCTVELEGLGQIDNWIDGLKIDQAINRGFLSHGAPLTLTVPDEWRLPEAVVVAVGTDPNDAVQQNASGNYHHCHGRIILATNSAGNGSYTGSFSPVYGLVPYFVASADDQDVFSISSLTTSAFTLAVNNGPISSYVVISWHAQGY